jgi:hypothetical protein
VIFLNFCHLTPTIVGVRYIIAAAYWLIEQIADKSRLNALSLDIRATTFTRAGITPKSFVAFCADETSARLSYADRCGRSRQEEWNHREREHRSQKENLRPHRILPLGLNNV